MVLKSDRRVVIWIVICVAIGPAGCSKSAPNVDFATTQGTVRINGRPQRQIQVLFSPDPEKGNGLPAFAGGVSDDQGNYTLKYSYHNKTGDGAPVGWNRVVLTDLSVGYPREGQAPKPSAVPPAYGAPATTPLLVEVKAGDNKIDLDVKK
jgi:hypothetical protein